jgi:hypothetical protein
MTAYVYYILLFGFLKAMDYVPVDILGAVTAVIFLFCLLDKNNHKEISYVILILSNSIYAIILVNLILLVISIFNCIKEREIDRNYFSVLIVLSLLTFQTIINFNSLYDGLRLVSIVLTITTVFYIMPILKDNSYERYLLFTISTLLLSNVFFINFISDNSRVSIFTGSENIALMIFYIMTLLLFHRGRRLAPFLILLIFSFFAESRTLIILPLLHVFIYLLVHRRIRIGYVLVFTFFIGMFTFYLSTTEGDSRVFRALDNIETISQIKGLSELEIVDPRGALVIEGIKKYHQKPLFGHGVIKPDFFKLREPDSSMPTYHNSLIDLLVTYGLVGLIIFILAIYFVYKKIIFSYGKEFVVLFFLVLGLSLIQPYIFNLQVMTLLFTSVFIFNKKARKNE